HEDSNDASVDENVDDKTIGVEVILSPTAPDVDEIQDTYPSGFFWRLLYTCVCKCFS
ncbi:CCP, partial [Trifolium medium]|nr:CCP [Trifolium medium]